MPNLLFLWKEKKVEMQILMSACKHIGMPAGYYCSSNSSTNQPTGTGGKGDNSTYYLAAVDSFFFQSKIYSMLSL
jgi:hypothetical protein